LTLDLILGVLLLLSLFKGWRSGALSMLLSIAVLIFAALAASAVAQPLGNIIRIGPEYGRPVVGFFFAFVVFLLAGGFLKRLLKPKQGVLRGLDALIGATLGLVRGAFILSLLLIVLKLINLPPEHMRESSRVYSPLLSVAPQVAGVLRPLVPTNIVRKPGQVTVWNDTEIPPQY
jgi:membrane protein required for colicin V production